MRTDEDRERDESGGRREGLTRKVSELRPHPENIRIYGEPDDGLADSIRKVRGAGAAARNRGQPQLSGGPC